MDVELGILQRGYPGLRAEAVCQGVLSLHPPAWSCSTRGVVEQQAGLSLGGEPMEFLPEVSEHRQKQALTEGVGVGAWVLGLYLRSL